jgi:subtilisin family serine protease
MVFSSFSFATETESEEKVYDFSNVSFTRDFSNVSGNKLSEDLINSNLADDADVRIIVELEKSPMIETATMQGVKFTELSGATVSSLEEAIASEQQVVLNTLSEQAVSLQVHQQFDTVFNGFSMTVKKGDLEKIADIANVKAVYASNEYARPEVTLDMINSSKLTNSLYANETLGYKGEGLVVSIIDTGIDPYHKDMQLDPTTVEEALTAKEVSLIIAAKGMPGSFFTAKVPYGYNYMDRDFEIRDLGAEASMHGMHVAGTVAADGEIKGVAPKAQVLAMKVFGNDPEFPSTFGDVIIAAIDDSIKLGADVMNLSLGSTAAFVNQEDPEQQAITRATENGIVMAISAGNSAYMGNGANQEIPFPLVSNPDIGVVGSPGLVAESLQVASVDNYGLLYNVTNAFEGIDANIMGYGKDEWNGAFELVAVGGDKLGMPDNYTDLDVAGKVVLVSRGGFSFFDKTKYAAEAGAIGIIVYDHGLSSFYKNMGGWAVPFMKISKAEGLALEALLETQDVVNFTASSESYADPTTGQMSDFSSWGTTPDMSFKPDISAPGGNIWSTANDNGYQYMSGTSMAAPHAAGGAALVVERIEEDPLFAGLGLTEQAKVDFAKAILMNTAVPVKEQWGYASVRKQGAGSMELKNALTTPAVLTDKSTGLAKVNGGEIKNDRLTFTLKLKNYSTLPLAYDVSTFTQIQDTAAGMNILSTDAMQNVGLVIKVNGNELNGPLYVGPKQTKFIRFEYDFTNAVNWNNETIDELFPNGNFVESIVFFNKSESIVNEAKVLYDAAVAAEATNTALIAKLTADIEQYETDIEAKQAEIDAQQLLVDAKQVDIDAKQAELDALADEYAIAVMDALFVTDALNNAKMNLKDLEELYGFANRDFYLTAASYSINDLFQGDVGSLMNLYHVLDRLEALTYDGSVLAEEARLALYNQINDIISVLGTYETAVKEFTLTEDFLALSSDERYEFFGELRTSLTELQGKLNALKAVLDSADFLGFRDWLNDTVLPALNEDLDALVAQRDALEEGVVDDELNARIDALLDIISDVYDAKVIAQLMYQYTMDVTRGIQANTYVFDSINNITDRAIAVDNAVASLALAQAAYDGHTFDDYNEYLGKKEILDGEKATLQSEYDTLKATFDTFETEKQQLEDDKLLAETDKQTAVDAAQGLLDAIAPLHDALLAAGLVRDNTVDLSLPALAFYGEWDDAPAFDAPRHSPGSYYNVSGYIQDILGGLYYMSEVSAFSPNGDGIQDVIIPYLTVLRNVENLKVQIVDENKDLIKTLALRESARKHYVDTRGAKATFFGDAIFDGTANFSPLPEGQYYLRYQGDLVTGATHTQDIPLLLDVTAPVTGIHSYNYDNKLFTISSYDNLSGIDTYYLLEPVFENDELVDLKVLLSNKTGQFDLTELDEQPLFVTYAITDYAGNEGLYTNLVQLIEGDVPNVTLDVEAFGIINTQEFVLNGTVTDALPSSVLVDGQPVELVPHADDEGVLTFSVDMDYDTDGKKGIFVEAIDLAGNRTGFTRWFYIDSTPATIDLVEGTTTHPAGQPIYFEYGTEAIEFDVTVWDNFPFLKVKVNDSVVHYEQADFFAYEDQLQPMSHTFTETLDLQEGQNFYVVSVEDAYGTVTTNVYVFYLLADGEEVPGTEDPDEGEDDGDGQEPTTPTTPTTPSVPVTPPVAFNPTLVFNVTLNASNVELEVGTDAETTTFDLDATVSTGSQEVVWSSDNEEVATVDAEGIVTAVAPGTAVITATRVDGTQSASATVEVFLVGEEESPLGAVTFNDPYMTGYPDGTFRPEGTITRAELAVVYSKILNLNINFAGSQKFTDVDSDHWAYNYVQAVARTGIFSGYGDGTFKPDQPINRGELAATFSKFWAFKSIDVDSSLVANVLDVQDHWAANHIYKLFNAKVVEKDLANYEPDAPATRGTVVQMVNNLLGRQAIDTASSKFIDVKDLDLMGDIEAATSLSVE